MINREENYRFERLFVTVGTTKFSKLINTITRKSVLDTLYSLGIRFIQLQTGKDFTSPYIDPHISEARVIQEDKQITVLISDKITLKYNDYFEDFESEIQKSDLVISHAGAGSCLDVLRNKKPLLVVINEDLMDNHQSELAEVLENEGYLYGCTCDTVEDALKKNFSVLKTYPEPQKGLFSNFLDRCMGYV